jgi:putative two-component system response regulator
VTSPGTPPRGIPETQGDPLRAIDAAAAAIASDSLRRVLVVDDEETIRLALSRFLRNRGYEVDQAASGQQALECLSNHKYAVMLCDLRMPGMSGLEVLPHALARDPDLGIVMLTAT